MVGRPQIQQILNSQTHLTKMESKQRKNLGILTSLFPSLQSEKPTVPKKSGTTTPTTNNRSIVRKCKHCAAKFRATGVHDEGFCSKECRAMDRWYMPESMDQSSGIPIPVRKPRQMGSDAAGPAKWRSKSPVPKHSPDSDTTS